MYRVAMYYTIKTLFEKGHSRRQISRQLGIHRRTVTSIISKIQQGTIHPQPVARGLILQPFEAQIREKVEKGYTARLIHDWLVDQLHCNVSYPSVARFVRKLEPSESFVPQYSEPGQEAQVDFGYLGRFAKNRKKVKVWCFAMTLSHSRLGYYRLVTDQRVESFIACHIHAFEFFTGVPRTVVLDNLKAGVVKASFYEPVFQSQYAHMLEHYGSSPITARPRRPQDKGKVESAIKYVKGNFLPSRRGLEYEELVRQLEQWYTQVANPRVHGTTRQIPLQIWEHTERPALLPLPMQRFELWKIEQRKVSKFGHVAYGYNYYSVPSHYTDQTVHIHCNQHVVKIFRGQECIATHARCLDQGKYITQKAHHPSKGQRTKDDYEQAFRQIGPHAYALLDALQAGKPRHWHEIGSGILSLRTHWADSVIDLACQRALYYQAISYRMVKQIIEQRLWELPLDVDVPVLDPAQQGHGHWLGVYDQLASVREATHATP